LAYFNISTSQDIEEFISRFFAVVMQTVSKNGNQQILVKEEEKKISPA